MIERQTGAIVNIASVAGLVAGKGGAAYTASKHAVIGYTKHIASEYARYGIKINAICPGTIETPLVKDVLANLSREAVPTRNFGSCHQMLSYSVGIAMVYIGSFLFGIGFSGSTLLPPVVIREVFGGKDYATIYTTIMSASTLGVAVGTTMFSFIFDSTGSYYSVFIIVIAFFIAMILSSLISLNWMKKLNV